MRQVGIIAAAGIIALEKMVDRLPEDHANAKLLAEGLYRLGFDVDLSIVETNMVYVPASPVGMSPAGLAAALARLDIPCKPSGGTSE